MKNKIERISEEIYHKLKPYSKKKNGFNVRNYMVKESMIMYCSIKQFSEPENVDLWIKVSNHIKKNVIFT